MILRWLVLLLAICQSGRSWAISNETRNCDIKFTVTQVVLSGVPFTVRVTFPPYLSYNEPLPQIIYFSTEGADFDTDSDSDSFVTRESNGIASLSMTLTGKVNSLGHHTLNFNFSRSRDQDLICPTQSLQLLAIPGILTIFPPIIAAILAIVFRQVLLALLVGVWLCAFLGNKYNPLTALLRTLDTYFVGSLGELDHAAIVVFTFILGGLIGVVQKSGGGIGLGRLLYCFTSTRRRASLVCVLLAAFIFFDDYSCVLIAGISLRTVMSNVGVSRDKFAYILKSLGPTLPSMVPVSSWIGVEVGYLKDTLKSVQCLKCSDQRLVDDPFVLVVRSIPYRFFPWLMIFTVVIVCVLGRDFGCMLKAERASRQSGSTQSLPDGTTATAAAIAGPSLSCPSINHNNRNGDRCDDLESSIDGSERVEGCCSCQRRRRRRGRELERSAAASTEGSAETTQTQRCCSGMKDEDLDESVFTGSLAPKRGVPYRWFNAVVPFLLTVVVTLIGMIVGGRQKILDLPPEQNVTMSVVNIFTYADSVSSLIWASSLSSAVLLVMLLIQKILSLQEFMDSFIAGVQDVIEPTFTFILAWALGTAMQDIHTNTYIAQALNSGGVRVEYLPPLITIIGYLISFAAGSAFGTMGILFPLVIPTICELESVHEDQQCRVDIIVQAAAAIMASSIFGNVASPIAGLTILTVFASQTTLVNHIRTGILYSIIIGAVAIIFGALPVGAGWYPWYAAWLIMSAVMCIIFALLSSSVTSSTSRPLLKRIFPFLYTYPAHVWNKLNMKFKVYWGRRPCRSCHKLVSQVGDDEVTSTEETPLISSNHHDNTNNSVRSIT